MQKYRIYLLLIAFFGLILTNIGWSLNKAELINTPKSSTWLDNEISKIQAQKVSLNPKVLRLSLLAYKKAAAMGLTHADTLTVIDYSQPSTAKRLWVFNLKNGKTLFNTWVSHGKNSGDVNATAFSNNPGSLQTSIGVFLTEHTYDGKNGYSLKLMGLEHGYNDNAYDRSIVVHGAPYVNPDIIAKDGRIGRSWGCPAVSKSISTPLINTIKNQTVLFAYYPNKNWLTHSKFLTNY